MDEGEQQKSIEDHWNGGWVCGLCGVKVVEEEPSAAWRGLQSNECACTGPAGGREGGYRGIALCGQRERCQEYAGVAATWRV